MNPKSQFMKFYALIILGALYFVLPTSAFAQELRENSKGEKIIVYPDGTWEYFMELEGSGAEEGSKEVEKKKIPTFSGTIAPLEGNISITEDDFRRIANREMQIAQSAADIAKQRAKEATEQRKMLEGEVFAAKGADEKTRSHLNLRLRAAKKTEQDATAEAERAAFAAEKTKDKVQSGRFIEDFKANLQTKGAPREIKSKPVSEVSYHNLIELDQGVFAVDAANNTVVSPPRPECHIAFDGVDNFNGQQRVDVQKQLLFTYTDDRLRPYLNGKEYLVCEGFLTALAGGYRYLSLQFTFAYPNAREAYGFIEKGSVLTLLLLDGNYINLQSGKMDRGSYNTEEEVLTYRVHYPITRSDLNALRKSDLSKVRVFWSSGHEDYEVYQVDFFINQIGCLEKKGR